MSDLNGNLNTATNLNGSLTDASGLAGSLNLDDNITGSLTSEHVLNGSLTPTSTMSGLLGIYGEGGTSDYNELDNKPSINNVTLQGNKTTEDLGLFSGNLQDINYSDLRDDGILWTSYSNGKWGLNSPASIKYLSDVSYRDPMVENGDLLKAVQHGSYASWELGKPSPVVWSGDYNDLTNKPTIPAAQVNSDWSSNSGVSQILNKPTLATVATSGSYNDLSDKPTIPTNFYIPYRDTETQIGTWLDGVTPVYQKYIDLGSTKTLAPNTNVNLAPLAGNILLLGGGCIRIDTSYTGYFPYIQLVANGTYLQGNNIRNTSVGINAVLIQYVYRS